MKKFKIAIVGATGAVGREMLRCVFQFNFPFESIKLLASARSAGKEIEFEGHKFVVEELTENSFEGVEVAFWSAGGSISEKYMKYAVEAGCVNIDNTSHFRMDPNVPLVVPEVNGEALKDHHGIISCPNCTTIMMCSALTRLNDEFDIERIVVSTYQAVSGAGSGGISELDAEIKAIAEGRDFAMKIFPYQIAYNLIPQIGGFDEKGYSSEEMKFQNEGRKILNNPKLKVNCTCIRVPVYRSHSESITIEFKDRIDAEKAREILSKAEGVKLVDDPQNKKYPMPLDTSDQDLVYVGRIREDISNDEGKGLTLWCCGDQVRKGAATNAVQIAELLIKKEMI